MDTPQRAPRPTRRLPQKSPNRPQARDFLGSLKIWQKLLLITAAFVIPLFIVVGLLIRAQNTNINFAAKEIRGVEYLKPAKQLLLALEQHLAVSDRVLRGDESALPRQAEAGARVDAALADLVRVDQLYGGEFGTRDQVQALAAAWDEIQLKAGQGTVGQNAFRHLDLLRVDIPRLFSDVGNASNLILDPDQDSYYVMSLSVTRLLELESTLNTVLDRTNSVLYRNEITHAGKGVYRSAAGLCDQRVERGSRRRRLRY